MTVAAEVVDVPARSEPAGGHRAVSEWPTVGPSTGFQALAQAVLEYAPGCSGSRATGRAEEVLFVVAGEGILHLAGFSHALEPESGAYLTPGEEYELENRSAEPMRIVSVRIPDPDPPRPAAGRTVVRRLSEQEAQAATSERQFRVVADPRTGLRSATQFVGYIPSKRAPEHFHAYDEVIYVLDGEGVLHAGGARRPLRASSSIQLPAGAVHCLENTGEDVMRVVAVFRPAGSPAAAYYPDGTPAYPGTSAVST